MYRFILNETSYHGRGSRIEVANEILARGFKKVLLVSDKILNKVGVLAKVEEVLKNKQIAYEIFDDIKPNPTMKNCNDCLAKLKEFGADVIVAVGGGSVMDTAKCVGIVSVNPEFADIRSLEGVAATKNKSLPIIALPTTCGTAAEVTINYVITDEENARKMVCIDPHDIPVVAIVDSELMESMPTSLIAATGMDALTHAVEGYLTAGSNAMGDMFELYAIELIAKNLPKATQKDMQALENMALAQYIAGMGFSNVGLGIVHSMAHPMGAIFDIPHGVANAMLLPTVMQYNLKSDKMSKYKFIAKAMGANIDGLSDIDAAELAVKMVDSLAKEVKIPVTLTEIGIKESDLQKLSENAFADVCTGGNPRHTSVEDIYALYKSKL